MNTNNPLRNIISIWGETARITRAHPGVTVPFLLLGMLDAALLLFLYFAPYRPLATVAGPLLGRLGAGGLLRYPESLALLPQAFTALRDAAGLAVGTALTAVAVVMVSQAAEHGMAPDWRVGVRKALRRYGELVVVWILPAAIVLLIAEMIRAVRPFSGGRSIGPLAGIVLVSGVHMLFAFVVPAIAVENRKLGAAVRRSLLMLKEHPLETAGLVLLPNTVILPMVFVYSRLGYLLERFSPDVILYSMGARIVLLAFINYMVFSSLTVMFIARRRLEKVRVTG